MPTTVHHQPHRRALVWLFVGMSLVASTKAYALHRETPGAIRVTSGNQHFHPGTRSWDRYLAFSSDVDLLGTGSTGRQVFVFSLRDYTCQRGTPENTTPCPDPPQPYLQQITFGPGDADNPSVTAGANGECLGGRTTANRCASIPFGDGCTCTSNCVCETEICDGGGQLRVAFDAFGSYNGGFGAATAYRQVFLLNLTTGETTRVTNGTTGHSTKPSLSGGGRALVFESTASLGVNPGPPGTPQVWLYTEDEHALLPISNGAAPSTSAMLNHGGTRVAFQSRAALNGNKQDTGIWNIYLGAIDRRNLDIDLFQITNGNGDSIHPWLAEKTGLLAFESVATNLPGTGGGPGRQIYTYDAPADANLLQNLPQHIQQRTYPSVYGDCSWPTIDPGANRIGFICTGDPLGNGTVGNRLFVWDTQQTRLFQLTGQGDVPGPISLSLGQWFVSFADNFDLTGGGACGYQLHIVDYYDGHWGAAQGPGQLPFDIAVPPDTNVIGARAFEFQPYDGLGGGSFAEVTTSTGVRVGGFYGLGALGFEIEAPSLTPFKLGEADVFVRKNSVIIPPIAVAGVGTLCADAISDGQGVIDCNGGRFGRDQTASQDHIRNDVDTACQVGCREGDACHGDYHIPPHYTSCPRCVATGPAQMQCVGGTWPPGVPCTTSADCPGGVCAAVGPAPKACDTGPLQGFSCTQHSHCHDPSIAAECASFNNLIETCNGALVEETSTAYDQGAMVLTLPLTIALSSGPGADQNFCTADDVYLWRDVLSNMRLTTGVGTSTITDANNTPGSTLTNTDTGAPFSCQAMKEGDLGGAVMVGTVTMLDIPGFNDLILTSRMVARPRPFPADYCAPTLCFANADCDDGDPCNGTETCSAFTCTPGTPLSCNDGSACTSDSCTASGCVNTPVSCDDSNVCTTDSCNPATGCTYAANTNPCSDSNLCTTGDVCSGGSCVGAPTVCTDSNACNGLETCNPGTGACQGGAPPNCTDTNPCTTDSCNIATGCVFTNNTDPCSDGSVCTTGDVCSAGFCLGAPVVCSDGNMCNGVETCHTLLGCQTGVVPNCNDGNACTDDSCVPATGCSNTNNANTCSDGSLCTTGDTCSSGSCIGTPTLCNDGDVCNGVESCDPGTGACLNPVDLNCDDLNPCTDDFCDAINGCVHVPNTMPCNDGSLCTTGDTCSGGTCVGAPVVCGDGNACNGIETCNTGTGACQAGTPPNCDDGNPCTTDGCNSASGCFVTNNTNSCSDGNACTSGDVCAGGSCSGTPVTCDDGNMCNGTETCDTGSGSCTVGTPLVCNDSNDCTTDSCNPGSGCAFTNNSNPCSDGSVCTQNDVCSGGACTGNAIVCDDGDACNGTETCDASLGCQAGAPVNCDDSNACTQDLCNVDGSCSHLLDLPCALNQLYQALVILEGEVSSADVNDIGGENVQRKLGRLAVKARNRVLVAIQNPSSAKSLRSLTLARKAVVRFHRLCDRQAGRGKMDTGIAANLMGHSDAILSDFDAIQ